jgi:hypothetical protein
MVVLKTLFYKHDLSVNKSLDVWVFFYRIFYLFNSCKRQSIRTEGENKNKQRRNGYKIKEIANEGNKMTRKQRRLLYKYV